VLWPPPAGLAGSPSATLPDALAARALGVSAVWAWPASSGPLGVPLSLQCAALLDGALAALRTCTDRALAFRWCWRLGIAHVLPRRVPRPAARAAICAASAAVLAGLGLPYLNGQALHRSFTQVHPTSAGASLGLARTMAPIPRL